MDQFLFPPHFEFAGYFNDEPGVTHQPPDPTVTNIYPNLFQFFRHPWAAIAA